MPIVIPHNGVLNNLTEGLAKGLTQGKELQAQKEAIEEAKKRRALEERRVAMAESNQQFERGLQESEEQFRKGQRAYTEKLQGQHQEDRASALGERSAAQEGNARSMRAVLADERAQPTPQMQARAGALAGGAAGGAGGASSIAGLFTEQDRIEVDDAVATARHMDPERGARHVQETQERIEKQRLDALKPKLIEAWKATLTNAEGGQDPDNPPSLAAQSPEMLARAQANIKGLADRTVDLKTSMRAYELQQQDLQERRREERLKKTYGSAIQNRIARMEEMAQTNPELEQDLLDRIDEAQTYLDLMGDPDVMGNNDVRELYTKAMGALHGRGTSSTAAKKQRSYYSEARKLAQDDLRGAAIAPDAYEAKLDALTQKHLEVLKGEDGGGPAPGVNPGRAQDRFSRPVQDDPIQGGAGSPAAASAQAQGVALPGTGASLGGEGAGAQDFSGPEWEGAPKTIDEWKTTKPDARDQWLTKIALEDPAMAVEIAAQLGLKPADAKEKDRRRRTITVGKDVRKHQDELIKMIEGAKDQNDLSTWRELYLKNYGKLPDDVKIPTFE